MSVDIESIVRAAVAAALQAEGPAAPEAPDSALQAEYRAYVERVERSGHGASPRSLPDYIVWRMKGGSPSEAVKRAAAASPEASDGASDGASRKQGDLIVHWHGASRKYGDRRFSIGGPEAHYREALQALRAAGLPVAPDRDDS